MNVLVVNCGSSSIKISVVDPTGFESGTKIKVERIDTETCSYRLNKNESIPLGLLDHAKALEMVLPKKSLFLQFY